MSVVVGLARKELKKYNLVGWLPTFVSDTESNVRRALAGRMSRDMFREGETWLTGRGACATCSTTLSAMDCTW